MSNSNAKLSLVLLCAREVCTVDHIKHIRECVKSCPNDFSLFYFHKTNLASLNVLKLANSEADSDYLAESIFELQQAADATERYRSRILRAMDIVKARLDAANVRFVYIRGPRLAERYYENPALRISTDVDVLVRKEDYKAALELLLLCGFRAKYHGVEEKARAVFKGQTVLRHPKLRLLVDVNWLLTGNSGIGKIEEDIEEVWNRAKLLDGCEWQLSTEDVLFGLIRHVGHGHGFEHGLVQCCMDVAAILRKEADVLDWNYFWRVACRTECARVVRLFAYFYDTYYRDETMISLSEWLPATGPQVGLKEREFFAKFVLLPLISYGPTRSRVMKYAKALLCHAGKLWALDSLGRLRKLLTGLLWPDADALVVMTPYSKTESLKFRRLQYFFAPLIIISPPLVLGAAIRILVAILIRR